MFLQEYMKNEWMNVIMKKFFLLSLGNILFYKYNSIIKTVFITIMFFVLIFNRIFSVTINNSIHSVKDMIGADYIIAPVGLSEDLVKSYCIGSPNTILFEEEKLEPLYNVKDNIEITKRIMIASIENSCCDSKIQLIGIDTEKDKQILSLVKSSGKMCDDSIIVGNDIAYNIGDRPRFYNHIFTVSGKLKKTGMGYDTSIFLNIDYAKKMNSEFNKKISIALVNVQDSNKEQFYQSIQKNIYDSGLEIYESGQMLGNITGIMGKIEMQSKGYSVLIVSICIVALFSVSFFEVEKRKKEFDTYEILGLIDKNKLFIIIYRELLISIIGLFFALVGLLFFIIFFNNLLSSQYDLLLDFHFGNLMLESLKVIIAFLVCYLIIIFGICKKEMKYL